ncbi:hypothetical protein RCL1_006005 [Eukaryota sp. TZLM3-RCL]
MFKQRQKTIAGEEREVISSGIGRPESAKKDKDVEPVIQYHTEEHQMGPTREKSRVVYEPISREKTFTEEFEKVVIQREDIPSEESSKTREVRETHVSRTRPVGYTKQLLNEYRYRAK